MDRISNSIVSRTPLDRVALAANLGWSVSEVYRARDAWRKLYVRQPESTLSFGQYIDMILAAGLRPLQIGLRRGQWHLARPGDSGSYTIENCRFVPQEVNQRERKEGYQARPEFRLKARQAALARSRNTCPHCDVDAAPGMFARWHGAKCRSAAP